MAAIASVALVSCSNEEYFGDPGGLTGERAISFDMSTPAMTRAEDITGADAADKLGYSFQVYATKTVGSTTSNVFSHSAYSTSENSRYWAWYVENTAGKTNSNLNNWEYVGGTGNHGKTGYQVTLDNAQTIKYWDLSAASYSFMAFKAKPVGDPAASAGITNVTTNGFTVTGTPAQLANLYVADKEIVTNTANGTGNIYGSPVKFKFRNFTSKIRFGIYENIPGYTVKIDKVYYGTGTDEKNSTTKFGVTGSFSGSANESYGFTVTYDADGRAKGAHSSGTAQNYFETDNSTILSATAIGTTATGATYDQAAGAYSIIMPNPTNDTGMTLTVDITLTSEGGSGETIKLTKASATIPANYCQWQSNFAYTYLFKISDLTQFQQGQLSPITLDAVITEDDEGYQNTITVVEDPSITTYQAGKVIYDDYVATAGDIFVTVSQIESANVVLKALTTGNLETVGNAALYTISLAGQTSFTEAEIEKALKVRTSALTETTVEGRNGIILTPATLTLTHKIVTQSGEQTVSEGETYKAAKFTPEAPTAPATVKSYAFVYTVKDSKDTEKDTKYEAVPNLTVGETSVAGLYCEYKYNAASDDAQSGVTYYSQTSADPETYAVLATQPTFFGDDATDLYIEDPDNAGQYIAATGKVKTGVTYYTTNTGTEIDASRIISYTGFASATLYTEQTNEATAKTETTPAANTTYYKRTGGSGTDGDPYTYARVYILPQQLPASTYTRDATPGAKYACPAGEKAIAGEKYYDRYEMYEGKYAVKVIKVQ